MIFQGITIEKGLRLQTFKKKKSDYLYSKFSFYHELVKTTIKPDRRRWLNSIDDNLNSQPKQFRKCMAPFRKINSAFLQL
jgi:hypothetical protein